MGFDLHRFDPQHPPALLLGGLNLVRALGLGGIPVIVASPEPDWPAQTSRFAQGNLLLPPLAQREAVLETLTGAGKRFADALGRKVPLFYGDDEYLSLVQRSRAALAPFYSVILNDVPKVYDVFSWTDPVPFFKDAVREVRLRIPRLGARLARWLSTAS
jgi:predicted ATP-grasp superfamily ATP-dependent carboligase